MRSWQIYISINRSCHFIFKERRHHYSGFYGTRSSSFASILLHWNVNGIVNIVKYACGCHQWCFDVPCGQVPLSCRVIYILCSRISLSFLSSYHLWFSDVSCNPVIYVLLSRVHLDVTYVSLTYCPSTKLTGRAWYVTFLIGSSLKCCYL